MNYGFLVDTRSCIGCHACSTACKSENDVPLGVNRTWVKTTETGTYPDTQRHFQVTRCNHCANPPCVRICPVTAMVQRPDGIVAFESDQCIGCKACLQACPYDAIHIDPDSGTAAKCHFCGHRVEQGFEPACVVVCPTHSIVAGDLDDPLSEIARLVAQNPVSVRKPEQGTAPKLFYVGGTVANLHPTAAPPPSTMMFTDVVENNAGAVAGGLGQQGAPSGGPIQIAPGRQAEQMMQVAYTAQHAVPWHWQVPAYLVTKGIGAGVFILLALGVLLPQISVSAGHLVWGGLVAMLGLAATTVLLVGDLERPERFLRIVFRPQWRSWLTRGAFVLIGFTNLGLLWWGLEAAAMAGVLPHGFVDNARPLLAVLIIPAAVMGAIYTAFLFAQCEGRDLWQSPLLPPHLLVQALMAGAAALSLMGLGLATPAVVGWVLAGTLVADLFMILAGEFGIPHASDGAARAARDITHGRYARLFWVGAIALGHAVPLALLAIGGTVPTAVAGLAALIGLYAYEHAFVMAPQHVPNS